MYKIINTLGFQAGWWACIYSVAFDREIEAILLCLVLAATHVARSTSPFQEIKLGVLTGLLGVLVDSLLQYFSVIQFNGWALSGLSPFWLWALWFLFAMTLNASLDFLKQLPLFLTATIGWVVGPLNYYAGARLGAAQFEPSPQHVLIISVTWAAVICVLVRWSDQGHDKAQQKP